MIRWVASFSTRSARDDSVISDLKEKLLVFKLPVFVLDVSDSPNSFTISIYPKNQPQVPLYPETDDEITTIVESNIGTRARKSKPDKPTKEQ